MSLKKQLKESAQFISSQFDTIPKIAAVMGTGLGDVTLKMNVVKSIDYADIPYFITPSVQGHSGKLLIVKFKNSLLLIFKGRIHSYEGHRISDVVYPIRLMAMLKIKNLILTNASGSLDKNFHPGQLVAITDHINLTGLNPLIGKNHDFLGPRFFDMSNAYDQDLLTHAKKIAKKNAIPLKQGIYLGVLGPNFETPAEIKMMKKMGADLVGMSTVCECITARHSSIKVLGISCVSNYTSGVGQEVISHENVQDNIKKSLANLKTFLEKFCDNFEYKLDD